MDIDQLENPHFIEATMGDALKVLISNELKSLNANEIMEMFESLEKEDDSVRGAFCDKYDLGESIYDSFDMFDIDVDQTIMDIYSKRLLVEEEANKS